MKPLSTTQQRLLFLVGTLGYLTTRDLAQLCWPEQAPAVALVTAQAAGKKLRDLGYVLGRKQVFVADVSIFYVLTTKGARVLNEHYLKRWAADPTADIDWFSDGYNLSITKCVARAPLIELLHRVSVVTDWQVVGQRALQRGFLGLRKFAHFDAVLLDAKDHPIACVYLAHPTPDAGSTHVCKLARGPFAFLIAAATPVRLAALIKWRNKVNPEISEYLANVLPEGFAG